MAQAAAQGDLQARHDELGVHDGLVGGGLFGRIETASVAGRREPNPDEAATRNGLNAL